MQPINYVDLARARDELILWQKKEWTENIKGLCLHVGCGHTHIQGAINIDPYIEDSDCKDDMRYLPSFKENTVDKLISHHSAEHLPIRDVYPMLQRWFSLLKYGGTLEIAMPDAELCMQTFLEAPEDKKWTQHIYKIYGGETEDPNFKMNGNSDPTEYFEYAEGQCHRGGFSLGFFVRMLETIGFRITKADWYDAWGSCSFFVLAYKPEPPTYKSILERDVALGVFTNKCLYLPTLWESVNKFLPQIPFFTRIQRGPINLGMSLLQSDFRKAKKRFNIYLDDDIAFLNEDIIKNALEYLVGGKYGSVSVYSDFDDKCLITPYNPKERGLVSRPHRWSTGYFIAIDNLHLSDVEPDMNLVWPNQSCDTSFSAEILKRGWPIGISGDYVYHTCKDTKYFKHVIDQTNEYLMNKWGSFYFDNIIYDFNVDSPGWKREDCRIAL